MALIEAYLLVINPKQHSQKYYKLGKLERKKKKKKGSDLKIKTKSTDNFQVTGVEKKRESHLQRIDETNHWPEK